MLLSRNPLCAYRQLQRYLIILERKLRELHSQHDSAPHPIIRIARANCITETATAIEQTLYDATTLAHLVGIPLSEQEQTRIHILFRSRALRGLPPISNSPAVQSIITSTIC